MSMNGNNDVNLSSLDLDINECASADSNDCDINAACNNTEGSYICQCLDGYQGDGKNCTGKYGFWFLLLISENEQGLNNSYSLILC